MENDESKPERDASQRRFSQQQYDMLKRCSDKKDMTEWNEWRLNHPTEDIFLEEAHLMGLFLRGVKLNTGGNGGLVGAVHLEGAHMIEADLTDAELYKASLQRANLSGATLHKTEAFSVDMENAELHGANLEGAVLTRANLKGANLTHANLKNARIQDGILEQADLREAHLQGARLHRANAKNAIFLSTHMENSDLSETCLCNSNLQGAHLEGAYLSGTRLLGTNCHLAYVNGATLIWGCSIDNKTDFNGAALESARVEPKLKALLKYNIRRKNWEEWYKGHAKLKWLVKPFWWMSDYGISTGRIIATFFGLAFVFANIYYHWGRIARPGIVENLFVDHNGVAIQWWLVPLRTLYFSIVTQTTLGFGDMYANAHSIFGHILLSIQVILGYVLLGALVTRFAVLFTAGGPAGRFADEKEEKGETEKGTRERTS